MHAIASFTLVPVGAGLSLSPYIAAIEALLETSGLNFDMHSNGTNIEGEWDLLFATLRQCHELVHAKGAPRIHSSIQVGTRTDKPQKMADKLNSIRARRTK
jgi:uncharacterized protein (TIGR00106 family)